MDKKNTFISDDSEINKKKSEEVVIDDGSKERGTPKITEEAPISNSKIVGKFIQESSEEKKPELPADALLGQDSKESENFLDKGKTSPENKIDSAEVNSKMKTIKNKPFLVLSLINIALVLAATGMGFAIDSKNAEIAQLKEDVEQGSKRYLEAELERKKAVEEKDKATADLNEYKNGKTALLNQAKNAHGNQKWQDVINSYQKLSKDYPESSETVEAKKLADNAQAELAKIAKAEEERKASEEQERLAKEAQGFETGITYDQLARHADDYIGEKIKFTGKVAQIIYDDGFAAARLAVNSNYNTILYCLFKDDITKGKILEDDIITVYGTASGEYSYKSAMGVPITVPEAMITKIDQ